MIREGDDRVRTLGVRGAPATEPMNATPIQVISIRSVKTGEAAIARLD
jgi:hypothetical protein